MTTLTMADLLEELWECPAGISEDETRLWYSWLFEGTNAQIDISLWESACSGKGDLFTGSEVQWLRILFLTGGTGAGITGTD